MSRPADEEVFKRDGFCCVYCGFDGRTFEGWKHLVVDHFKPTKRGGKEELENLVTSCDQCNFMKGPWKQWPTLEAAKQEIAKWHDVVRKTNLKLD